MELVVAVLVGWLGAVAPGEVVGSVSERVVELPELGISVRDVRTVGPDGRIERVGLLEDGTVVDVDALRREDHALGTARRGKLAPSLVTDLAALEPGGTLEVAFWLVEPDGEDLGRTLRDAVRPPPAARASAGVKAERVATLERARERYAPGNEAFARAVADEGGVVTVVADAWPVVFARVDAPTARRLALRPEVDEAYRSMPVWAPEGDNAQGTLRTYTVFDQGVTADGSVLVMVNDPGHVSDGSIYLPAVNQFTGFDGETSHATGVAGNIANTHPQWFAAASGMPTILSGSGTGDAEAPGVWSAGIAAGIDFGNCSWWNFQKGAIEFLDRFFDFTVRTFGVMMFKSNGNQGLTGTPYGTSPGNGYNVTCSGNYNDGDNLDWDDDAMTASSSYWNPVEGHDKPEVASPGDCVKTTSCCGATSVQTCFGGTSSASPLTCGVAALISSADNTLLAQMTTVKAALMVSAWHNVEGAFVLSEKDGAGGVHAAAAYATVRDGQWWHDEVEEADFVADVLEVTMPLRAGDLTRVIALWFSKADDAFSTDVLEMDVDLTVLAPSGGVVASSASAVNPFELALFNPTETGDYTIRLTKQRFDGTSEPLTIAWSSRSDTATSTVSLAPGSSFAVGETPTLVFEDQYHPGGVFAAWAALSGAPGVPLANGYTLPAAVDAVSDWTLGLPGFVGFLDANGQSQGDMPLPPAPSFVGVEVHFGMVVFESPTVLMPISVSEGESLTISD